MVEDVANLIGSPFFCLELELKIFDKKWISGERTDVALALSD